MFSSLLKFEWQFISRKKALYVMLLFYVLLGLVTGAAANFAFPNTYKNGTYILNYIIGIISLLAIFSVTLLAAQTLFREKDARFEEILYAAPLRKLPYVTSRFTVIFCVTVLCYFLFVCGLFTGHLLQSGNNEEFGAFRLINYLQPFLVLLFPNILFCTAIVCCIGLLTKNKMLVYVSGVFIYFLYWGVSFYTNSPLIANSTPVSDAALKNAALIDPFGNAGFLEQTRYWSAPQRNNQLLQLRGHLLANRLIYLGVSMLLLFVAYRRFSFAVKAKKGKSKKSIEADNGSIVNYKPVTTTIATFSYDFKCLWSFIKCECLNILKAVPIWVICTGWIGFLGIELFSDISGNTRIPEKFATTAVMTDGIVTSLPIVALLVLLFYGNEIYWRSRTVRFDALENTSPVKPVVLLLSKWGSLMFIVLLLIAVSIITCVGIQLLKGYTAIDWKLYAYLFYLVGLPLSLSAGLIISIQSLIKNRYLGIAVAAVIIFLTNTSMGAALGIRHPLLKFANVFQGEYSEMNGFGRDLIGFHYKMIYWIGVTIVIFILVNKIKERISLSHIKWFSVGNAVLLLAFVASGFSGTVIFRQTNIPSRQMVNNWKQFYESKYSFLKKKSQPTITAVKTSIDLFPSEERYKVNGVYTMVNESSVAIDTIYMYSDKGMQWGKWTLDKGQLMQSDNEYGYSVFKLNSPLQPGDSVRLEFNFSYTGSVFKAAASFNTIINNGSFIRISRYFPTPGYNVDNEIEDLRERKKRNMLAKDSLLPLEAPKSNVRDFIDFDAIISTDSSQRAIGIGELQKEWKDGSRNYFHYKTPAPVPFRFAVASAAYQSKKIKQGNKTIESYYLATHNQNTDHILTTAAQSLDYFENSFGPYPFQTIRFIEISAFTKGFAGTAYPGSLFINENFGYQNKIDSNPERDILNEMVSHELSHAWWGNAGISPDNREGSLLMTETLAMYSELMLYKKVYGEEYLSERVNVHKAIYLSSRNAADEKPLYKSDADQSHLAYDKGMVVMYQLYKLLGEVRINTALKNFYANHRCPAIAPVSTDLLNEFYAIATPVDWVKIDELFKQIVTYDVILNKAIVKKAKAGNYQLAIGGVVNKWKEDGKGKSVPLPFDENVTIAVSFNANKTEVMNISANKGKIDTTISFQQQPVEVILDPDGRLLNRVEEVKSKKVVIE